MTAETFDCGRTVLNIKVEAFLHIFAGDYYREVYNTIV